MITMCGKLNLNQILGENTMKTKIQHVILAILLISGSGYADLSTGLVGYYPFNGNANDESGNGNNGYLGGTFATAT